MNLNNFTIKAQESVQKAEEFASINDNQAIETGHLLKGLLYSDEQLTTYLLKKLQVKPEEIRAKLEDVIQTYPKVKGGSIYFSNEAKAALERSSKYGQEMRDEYITIEHLLMGYASGKDVVARLLQDAGLDVTTLKKQILDMRKGSRVTSPSAEDTYQALEKYAKNLNDLAQKAKLDPVIGRDEEIRRVIQILSRRTKNNPILIGEPGVGKTAIAEGIAHRMVNGDVAENLKDKVIYSLDMASLIAGAKYKGEFEERLKSVVKEVIASEGDVILFIDEIHTLVGAGGGEGAMDAANILKPALSRGELRVIGATTLNEYQKYFEKDKALERRFQTVLVDEPSVVDTISILRGLKERYETHHQVRIKDDAIIAAAQLSQRYITDRFLPDKAIDLIDEAAAKLRMEINSVPEELDEIERKIRQLEIEREAIKRENDQPKLKTLSAEIANLVEDRNFLKAKWQAEKEVVNRIQLLMKQIEQYKYEADQAERLGEYGKVAELRYGKIKEVESQLEDGKKKLLQMQDADPMIKEEVNAEQIAEIVAKWTGIPVSRMLQSEREKLMRLEEELHLRVVGQNEAIEAVSNAIRRNRTGLNDPKRPVGSFIFLGTTGVGKTELARALALSLFDDENRIVRIDMSEYQEKHSVSRLIGAPPGYVGYEESGQLTEAVRRKPYSIVLFDEIEKAHPDVYNILLQVLDDGRLTDNKGRVVDFKNTLIIMTSNIGSHLIQENLGSLVNDQKEQIFEKTQEQVMRMLRQTIRPEFLNRIDDVIMFRPLTFEEIKEIVVLQLNLIKSRLKENQILLNYSNEAVDGLAKLGYDPSMGARPIKRVIQKRVLDELSKQILEGKMITSSQIMLDYIDNSFVFINETAR